MDNSELLRVAYALRDKGEYKEALDIFVSIADKQEDPLEKAGMLLNVVNTLPNAGHVKLAKTQLDSVRSLLSSSGGCDANLLYPRYHRYLTIAADLEDARISEAEGKFKDANDKIDRLRAEFKADLQDAEFQELHWAIERERGFALAHVGSNEAALQILEQVDRADPHDRFTLYYRTLVIGATTNSHRPKRGFSATRFFSLRALRLRSSSEMCRFAECAPNGSKPLDFLTGCL